MSRFDFCTWDFPAREDWPESDVVATGADLGPATLLYAYSHGMFPMHLDRLRSRLGWWSPLQRGILPLDSLRVSRSMRRSDRRYRVTFDERFVPVMTECANLRADGNWITEGFVTAYSSLRAMGHASSVEVLDPAGRLVGGLYGVRIDRFFAGESMFHRATDASKVALMHLVARLRDEGVTLLDVQWLTPHLASLGCVEVPRAEYLARLDSAVD